MKNKPEVGQKLFSLNIGNSARNVEQTLSNVTVTKVEGQDYLFQVSGK